MMTEILMVRECDSTNSMTSTNSMANTITSVLQHLIFCGRNNQNCNYHCNRINTPRFPLEYNDITFFHAMQLLAFVLSTFDEIVQTMCLHRRCVLIGFPSVSVFLGCLHMKRKKTLCLLCPGASTTDLNSQNINLISVSRRRDCCNTS